MATETTVALPRHLSEEADMQMMLAAEVHLGTKNCDFQMERYVFKRRNDGIPLSLSLSPSLYSLPFFFCLDAEKMLVEEWEYAASIFLLLWLLGFSFLFCY